MTSTPHCQPSLPKLVSHLAKGAKCANGLPHGEERAFQSAFREYAVLESRAKQLVMEILSDATSSSVDVLEKAIAMGEELARGVENYVENGGRVEKKGVRQVDKMSAMMRGLVEMEKPQTRYGFASEINNSRREPFRSPYLKRKYYGDAPLDLNPVEGHGMVPPPNPNSVVIAPAFHYPHPYEGEIETMELTEDQMVVGSEGKAVERTLSYVSTPLDLAKISALSGEKSLGIDLEAHSYHSFSGFTCLIQISTRDGKDFLVDPLILPRKLLHDTLAPILCDPSIVKIFHGCQSDLLWLQRDFGLHVLNIFDSYVASKHLKTPGGFSLANLLKKYLKISLDKKHQMADWRARPLPPSMLEYAANDTRHLHDLYDVLRGELGTALEKIFRASSCLATRSYHVEPFYPNGYLKLLPLYGDKGKDKVGTTRLRQLYDWRDRTARSSDESLHAICPNATLVKMAFGSRKWDDVHATKIMREKKHELDRFWDDLLENNVEEDAKPVFEMAGWVTPPPSDDEKDINGIHLHPLNQDYSSHRATPHSLNFFPPSQSNQRDQKLVDAVARTVKTVEEEIKRDTTLAFLQNLIPIPQPPQSDATPIQVEPEKPSQEPEVDEYVLPKSMKEIYQISLNNRKRKLQKPPATASKPSPDEEIAKDTKHRLDDYFNDKDSKGKGERQIMKEVGWMEQTPQPKKPKSIPLFDYGSVGAIGALATMNTSNNPFFSGAAVAAKNKKKPQNNNKKPQEKQRQQAPPQNIVEERTFVYKSNAR